MYPCVSQVHNSNTLSLLHLTHAVPVAVRLGHGRKSSSCRYNHQLELAHIRFLPLSALTPSAPRYQHKMQGDAAHRPLDSSHASVDSLLQRSPALCVR